MHFDFPSEKLSKYFLEVLRCLLQCLHPLSWPSSIWGSRKPLKTPLPVQRMPYPCSIRHSTMISLCWIIWTLIQTQSERIWFNFLLASSFFWSSVPLNNPQNPSLLLWQCLVKALAPTVNLDSGFFILCLYSSVHLVCGRLNPSFNCLRFGQTISWEPAVFRMPSKV